MNRFTYWNARANQILHSGNRFNSRRTANMTFDVFVSQALILFESALVQVRFKAFANDPGKFSVLIHSVNIEKVVVEFKRFNVDLKKSSHLHKNLVFVNKEN